MRHTAPNPLTPFTPSPAVAAQVLEALGNPDFTLRDVSRQHKTTVEALALWMTRPDIAARLHAIHSAITHRASLMANNFLPGAVKLLVSIINNHLADEHAHEPQPLAPEPRRHRENARKAANALVRLARLSAAPADDTRTPPAHDTPENIQTSRAPTHAPMPHASLPSSLTTASLPHLVAQAFRPSPSFPSICGMRTCEQQILQEYLLSNVDTIHSSSRPIVGRDSAGLPGFHTEGAHPCVRRFPNPVWPLSPPEQVRHSA